jgi:hypothetical protein
MPLGYEHRTWKFHIAGTGADLKLDFYGDFEEFKKVRREIGRHLGNQMVKVADKTVVPLVNRRAPYVYKVTGRHVVAKRGGNSSAYITLPAKGIRSAARIAGYLEFGGTVRPPILARRVRGGYKGQTLASFELAPEDQYDVRQRRSGSKTRMKNQSYVKSDRRRAKNNPSHAGAVSTPFGVRYIVTKPRRFPGKKRVQGAIKEARPAYQDALMAHLLEVAKNNGFEVD